MGVECAGEIEAVGESVTKFAVGDRVVALPEYKGWAELAAVPEKFVYKIPDELPFADATAIALPFVVAHILVYDLANIQPGRSVLVHSVGGAVVSSFSIYTSRARIEWKLSQFHYHQPIYTHH